MVAELYTAIAPDIAAWKRLRNVLGGSAGNFVEWFDWFA
mgnify:FL=1